MRKLVEMAVVNHVCKCESQCWPLQKSSSLSELSAVLYSGHEIPLRGAGYQVMPGLYVLQKRLMSVQYYHKWLSERLASTISWSVSLM